MAESSSSQVMMEMGFNIIYLIYIFIIVLMMNKRRSQLSNEQYAKSKWVLFAFAALLIGDFGHVGARLIAFASNSLEDNPPILGIGSLFEMVGLIFLFMFWAFAWQTTFNKPRNGLFYGLVAIGFIGLIIFTLPQNGWTTNDTPYWLSFVRNIPWFLQGVIVSILIIRDAGASGNKQMKSIGLLILFSYCFYMPVVWFVHLNSMLGMLMIPGTVVYMVWEYLSLKYYFPKAQ